MATFGAGGGRGRRLPGATAQQQVNRLTISGGVPLRAARGIGLATAQDPVGVAKGTGKGARDALTGIPSALVKTALETAQGTADGDPLRGVRHVAQDYARDLSRRYGPLVRGNDREFVERIKREGAAGELLDASALVSGGGGAAGRAAGSAARAGKLGERLERVASEPRRRARVTGGEARPQQLSRNLMLAAAQKAGDERRVRGQARRVQRADATDQSVDALVREAVGRGEVVPRRAASKARRSVAEEKGRELIRMKREQAMEVDQGARRQLGSLNRDERLAFKYATQLGIPDNPEVARRVLIERRAQIQAERKARSVSVPPVRRRTNDELAAIDHLIGSAGKAFTPRLRRVVRGEQARERRVAAADPGLDPVQAQLRRYQPVQVALGITRRDGESNAELLRRTIKAARAKGLERPGYFPSEKRPSARFSDRAVGGSRAIADPKRWTGSLYRTGRETIDPRVFEQSVARGIKRKRNWTLVADEFDRHSFEWGRNRSVPELLDELDRRGIDPDSVALWNPRRYRDAQRTASTVDAETERTGRGEEPSAEGLDRAVDGSTVTVKQLGEMGQAERAEFLKTSGWSVVPRAVFDEIHADTRPSGFAGRAWDVAKGKQARVLLGLSPAWLQFQVASNALLTGLAGTGPIDFAKAQVWWNRLSESEKAAVEPYVGIGHFQDAVQQTKLGAARTRIQAANHLVDSYRALKRTPFFQRLGRGNPLDLLFRVDNAQNNAFRRAVLYSQVKRDAYRRMNENANAIGKLQNRLVRSVLTVDGDDRLAAILRDKPALERHAQHVNDFLGDYSTYTAKERRTLGRAVMFYGFLRYSLRFALYTMPVKHPLTSSIIAQLGKLQAEEVRKLLGGDELPWALGKLYFNSNGTLKSVDLSRANPASNALTNMRVPKDALGLLPPAVVAAFDQAYSKTSFKDRPFRVRGETQGRTADKYSAGDRARVLLDQFLNLAAPYRAAEKATQSGPQGDDSMLFSERPTKYKRPDILASIADQERRRPRSVGGRLLKEFTPLVPRPDNAPEIAASIRQRNGGTAKPVVSRQPVARSRAEQLLERRAKLLERSTAKTQRLDDLLERRGRLLAGG